MGTYWYQPEGGVLAPGIYFEDDAAFEALKRQAGDRVTPQYLMRHQGSAGRSIAFLDGMTIFIATLLEAEALRALATDQREAPAKAAPLDQVWARWLKAMAGSYDATASRMVTAERMVTRQALREAARAMPRPRPRPDGLNRRARRAAAAMARRA